MGTRSQCRKNIVVEFRSACMANRTNLEDICLLGRHPCGRFAAVDDEDTLCGIIGDDGVAEGSWLRATGVESGEIYPLQWRNLETGRDVLGVDRAC